MSLGAMAVITVKAVMSTTSAEQRRVLLAPSNQRMNPASSAPQIDRRGLCGLSACWTA